MILILFIYISLEPRQRRRAENCKIMAAKHFELKVKSIDHIEGAMVVTQRNIDSLVAFWNSLLLFCFL
jgi:hypothetical protein